jgi:hypothetical protein
MTDFTHFLQEYHRQQQERLDATKNTLKSTILPALAASGVRTVLAEYSGYGDSGAIDGISYLGQDGKPVKLTGDAACIMGLEDALYEFLPAGFEINEGGQGTLTLNVSDCTAVLQHGQNVTEVNESTEEFDL